MPTVATLKMQEGWHDRFLEALRRDGCVTFAATEAGVSRQHAYKERSGDPVFAEQWDDALEQATDEVERALRRRAIERSDFAAVAFLNANRPQKYRRDAQPQSDDASKIGTAIRAFVNAGDASVPVAPKES